MPRKSSTKRCGPVPMPAEAKLSCPGRAFAKATSSFTVRTGREGCATSMLGSDVSWVTWAKSRRASYGTLRYIAGLIAMGTLGSRMV